MDTFMIIDNYWQQVEGECWMSVGWVEHRLMLDCLPLWRVRLCQLINSVGFEKTGMWAEQSGCLGG